MKQSFRILLFTILVTMICGVMAHSVAAKQPVNQNDKPYKATTVDECILEKECAWYHFSNQVFPIPRNDNGFSSARIIKWSGNMNIMFTGNNAYGRHANSFIKMALQLGPFANLSLEIANPSNALIIILNDWGLELNKIMPRLDALSAGGHVREFYNQNVDRSNGCMSLYLGDLQGTTIISSLIFINPDLTDVKYCMATQFYATFGLNVNAGRKDFRLVGSRESNRVKFTQLDQFVLFLLYQPEFSSGLDFSAAKNVFDKTYDKNKELFFTRYDDVKGLFENE